MAQMVLSVPRGSGHPKGTPTLVGRGGDRTHRGSRSIPGSRHRRSAPPAAHTRQLHRGAGAELSEIRRPNRGKEAMGTEGTAWQCHCPSAERPEQVSGHRSAPQGPEQRQLLPVPGSSRCRRPFQALGDSSFPPSPRVSKLKET